MRHAQNLLREAALNSGVGGGLNPSGCDPLLPAEASLGSVPILVGCTFVIKGRAGWQPIMKYLSPSDRCQDTEGDAVLPPLPSSPVFPGEDRKGMNAPCTAQGPMLGVIRTVAG